MGTARPYFHAAYAALHYILNAGAAGYLIGTVEDSRSGTPCAGTCANTGRRIPAGAAMVVAGDHAVNDIAGEDGKSWKSVLEAESSGSLRGQGPWEYPEIRAMT
jgi:cobalamin biosynthesis Co2+ chelatase CbiK